MQELCGWKYYNHAMIPTTAPHEVPDLSIIENGNIWKENNGALFARWTTDFDCSKETNWWFIIKEAPFDFDNLNATNKKHIRQGLKKCNVRIINAEEEVEALYRVYEEAYVKYKNYDNKIDYKQFCCGVKEAVKDGVEYWGAWDSEKKLIGWVTVKNHNKYVQTITAKFSANYLNLRASDALYYHILTYYLNELKVGYVCSGERSINHITNTQEYKIKTFGYRKVYCKLNIAYSPKINWCIKILYPFRKILKLLDRITVFHRINAVLKMESLVREQKKDE